MFDVTVGKVRTVIYTAINFTTGLTDLKLAIKPPSGTAPTATFTDLGNGSYKATYTPTIIGIYEELVSSVINGDNATGAVSVVAVDVMDLKADLDAFETSTNTSIAAIQASVAQILAKINGVKGGYIN